MTETQLESAFVRWANSLDIRAFKGATANMKGFPDRFVHLPNGGGTVYVEFKGTSSYGLSPTQKWWKKYLLASSPHRYYIVDTPEKLQELIEICTALMQNGHRITALECAIIKKEC